MSEVLFIDGSLRSSPREIGGKAFGLNRMTALGLPVPPAFVLPVSVHQEYRRCGTLTPAIRRALRRGIACLEDATGRAFRSGPAPLSLSVRSGAPHSMPGMMDTVLGVGAPDGHRDPWTHLIAAVTEVFDSWDNDRARLYRKSLRIAETGTAAVVQAMVYGDHPGFSGTGVLCTQDPTGTGKGPCGEWLPGRRGEALVSGTATPLPLGALAAQEPGLHGRLLMAGSVLEQTAGRPQEIEFTVENGVLWLLQTRALRIAERPSAMASSAAVLARGTGACPGRATGHTTADVGEAVARSAGGTPVVLVRPTTDPADLRGVLASVAVVTETGGITSHAAVVARELAIPCVVGCGPGTTRQLTGRLVTVDGTHGLVLATHHEGERP
ncbi:pyruvate, phosphate dikinase [Streptomyces griseocarneus]|nr:pyruvate, phosphate dikinase [Streptomyces griseocarneus]